MEKIGLVIKQESESLVMNRLKGAQSALIVHYSGLSAADLSALRRSLADADARFMVVKNSVAHRALKDAGRDELTARIDGPCGFVFSKDEPVSVTKILAEFAKTHEQLKVTGGFLHDKMLDEKDIAHLAQLPTMEVLRAQVVMAINAPRVKLVMALHYTLRKLVICLDKIKEKKSH